MSRLSRAAGLVSLGTLVSRVLGLLRDAVRALLFGAGRISDALDVAFKIPNLFRDLFAEGAFSGAFVPTLTRTQQDKGKDAAFALLNRVLSTMLVYVGGVVALLVVFAPAIVDLITAERFAEDRAAFEATVLLVRVLSPFLLLICLAVAAMGALNVRGRFFVPALSPATQNLLLVAGGLAVFGLVASPADRALPYALLLLLGGFTQFLVQMPSLWREGWRPRFDPDLRFRTPETREILRRMLPVAAGLAATHVSILINTRLATHDVGGTSNLYYAFRLVHLPVGLVGVAVGTVVLAEASRRVAMRDHTGLRRTVSEALLLNFALAAPAAAGLLALGGPIAKLLFQWGEHMTPDRAAEVGRTIAFFAPAVVFYCSVKVVVPVFYAQGRVRVPVLASFVAVAANVACALALHPSLRWNGLALAVGAGQAANLGLLLWTLGKDHPAAGGAPVLGRLLRLLLASGACGLAAWGTAGLFPDAPGAGARLLRCLVPVAAGAAAYGAALLALRCPEAARLRALLDRRGPRE